MSIWLRFWRRALGWAGVLALILTLRDLIIQFNGDYVTGMAGVKLVSMRIPMTIGMVLPFTGLAAAIVLTSSSTWEPRWRDAPKIASILASAGIMVFLLLGHLGPWVRARTLNSFLVGTDRLAVGTRAALWRQYTEALAQAQANPTFSASGISDGWTMAHHLGFMYHFAAAAGWLAPLLVGLGLLIGTWTRRSDRRIVPTAQAWVAGLFLLAAVTVSHQIGRDLTAEYGVPATAGAYAILIVPAILIIAFGWATWTARGCPYPGRNALDECEP
jgi:hypothetical protein